MMPDLKFYLSLFLRRFHYFLAVALAVTSVGVTLAYTLPLSIAPRRGFWSRARRSLTILRFRRSGSRRPRCFRSSSSAS